MNRAIVLLCLLMTPLVRADPDRGGGRRDVVLMDRRELLGEVRDVERLLADLMDRERNPRQRDQISRARNQLKDVREAVEDAPRPGERGSGRYRPNRFVILMEDTPRYYEDRRDDRRDDDRRDDRRDERPSNLPPPPPGRGRPAAIPDGSFNSFLAAIDAESFSANKLNVVRQVSNAQYFRVAHVRQVIDRFSFSKDKLAAVALLKPRILDPENAFELYQAFTFSGDKDELRRLLDQR